MLLNFRLSLWRNDGAMTVQPFTVSPSTTLLANHCRKKCSKSFAKKLFNAGMMACCQLLFGQLDMELHSNFDPMAA
jgi:hypothetical protein